VVYYLHADHLGSTSLATTYSGQEVDGSRTVYYPYGEQRWSASGGTLPTDFTFTGQRAEDGLGLMDYHARYYDPALGRFISADTIVPDPENPQDLNRYSYVRNSPLNYQDPSGHAADPGGAEGNPWLLPPQPTPPPLPVPMSPPSATPTPCEIQGCATDLSFNPFPYLGALYDPYRGLLEASVEYGSPEVFNLLKLPGSRAYMDTLHNDGVVMYGHRRGAWSVDDPRILWRTAPSVIPLVGDVVGAGIVIGQNVYDYEVGERRDAPRGEFYVSTGIDLIGYATSNLVGEITGDFVAVAGLAVGVSGTGVGAVLLYGAGNFAGATATMAVWDGTVREWVMDAFHSR
jgi:RHS repeat-associated protein